ncbi:MAG: oxygenase MpaB family protein [Limisphaerales bacterium]
MPPNDWSARRLEDARQRGDDTVRQLVGVIEADPSFGPRGFNRLLRVMDWLGAAPELMAVYDCPLERTVRGVPGPFLDFFDPQPLPDWVDDAKLARAARLWEDNTLALLFILYVASLPACYLLHRGIPALFRSGKLANRKYLPQRLYETGLMLDDVLDGDGLDLLEDHADRHDKLMAAALRECGLDGVWVWNGETLVRRDGLPGHPESEDAAAIARAITVLSDRDRIRGKRYVAGRGCLSARKVRFLHGYMRYLLLKEPAGSPGGAWDVGKLGQPVNQEDQAYTLLTFGYVMILGLERLGRRVTLEEREAFLHRWRLIGHLMGIEDGLMTDDWDEARQLFERIRDKEAGPSEEGRILTSTLLEFLEDLMPVPAGLSRVLPVEFAVDQVRGFGGDPSMLLSPEEEKERRTGFGRLAFQVILAALRWHYRGRELMGLLLPKVSAMVGRMLHPLAEELVASCWAAYARRPFYLPANLTQWQRDPGTDPEYLERLKAWRKTLFKWVLAAAGLLVGGGFLLVASLGLACFQWWRLAALAFGLGILSWWSFGELTGWVAGFSHRRPKPRPPGSAVSPPPPPSAPVPSRAGAGAGWPR